MSQQTLQTELVLEGRNLVEVIELEAKRIPSITSGLLFKVNATLGSLGKTPNVEHSEKLNHFREKLEHWNNKLQSRPQALSRLPSGLEGLKILFESLNNDNFSFADFMRAYLNAAPFINENLKLRSDAPGMASNDSLVLVKEFMAYFETLKKYAELLQFEPTLSGSVDEEAILAALIARVDAAKTVFNECEQQQLKPQEKERKGAAVDAKTPQVPSSQKRPPLLSTHQQRKTPATSSRAAAVAVAATARATGEEKTAANPTKTAQGSVSQRKPPPFFPVEQFRCFLVERQPKEPEKFSSEYQALLERLSSQSRTLKNFDELFSDQQTVSFKENLLNLVEAFRRKDSLTTSAVGKLKECFISQASNPTKGEFAGQYLALYNMVLTGDVQSQVLEEEKFLNSLFDQLPAEQQTEAFKVDLLGVFELNKANSSHAQASSTAESFSPAAPQTGAVSSAVLPDLKSREPSLPTQHKTLPSPVNTDTRASQTSGNSASFLPAPRTGQFPNALVNQLREKQAKKGEAQKAQSGAPNI